MSVVAEAADPSDDRDDQEIQGTERDALDHEGPPGLGAEQSDPIGITDPASNPEPVAEAPQETPAEPVAEWFDESAQKRAEFYGFDAETAKSYGSSDALERVYAAMDRQAAQWAKATGQEPAQREQEAPQAQTQQTQQAQQQARTAWEKYKIPLGEDYDPDAVKVFNEMNDHYDKVVRGIQTEHEQYITALAERQYAMEQAIQQYTGHQQAEENARFEREFDTSIASLGEEWHGTFGKSPTRMLAEGSPLRAARQAVWDEMNALSLADAKLNRPQSSVSDLVQRAIRSLYGDKFKESARKEILQQVKAQQSTQVERAGGQKPRPKTGVEAARQFVQSHPLIKAVRS